MINKVFPPNFRNWK